MWIIGSFVPKLITVFTLGTFHASAVTLFPFVFSRYTPDDTLRAHENTHLRQSSIFWIIGGLLAAISPWFLLTPMAFSLLYFVFNVIGFLYAAATVKNIPPQYPRFSVYSYVAWALNPFERDAVAAESDGSASYIKWITYCRPSNWKLPEHIAAWRQ